MTWVLIPGLLSDARVWGHLAEALPGPVVHADLTRDASIPDMAARLLAETDGPLVAVGHSLGGRVAMEMARQAPDRIRALVLVSTGHHPATTAELPRREARIAEGHTDMAALVADWLPPMVAPDRHGDTALMDDLAAMARGFDAATHERQIRALMARPDAGATLPELRCPVLLVVGDRDGWSPPAQHHEIAALVPDAEVRVIPGAGHFLPVERPADTVAVLTGWLADKGLLT